MKCQMKVRLKEIRRKDGAKPYMYKDFILPYDPAYITEDVPVCGGRVQAFIELRRRSLNRYAIMVDYVCVECGFRAHAGYNKNLPETEEELTAFIEEHAAPIPAGREWKWT